MKTRSFTRIMVIFFCLLSLGGVGACKNNKVRKTEQVPQIPEQAIEKFTVTETEGGKPHWVLDATSARILEKEKRALLQAPHIKFFQNGKYVSNLTADHGRINTENYDIWGDGKCVLDTAKGEHLETTNLYYKSDIKKIMTREKVKLVRPNEIIYGQGLEATPDLESITIKKQRVELRENK